MVLFVSAVVLAACGTPTPYQPVTDGHGYAEQSLESDRFRVTFSGNSLTPRETVENYLLYRAAEITLERGYDHFIVVEQETERSTTYFTTFNSVGAPYSYYGRRFRHVGAVGAVTTATARPRDSYHAFANILLRSGERPADNPNAYDARELKAQLSSSVVVEIEP